MQNGLPAKLILMNKKTGMIEMEHVLPTARPDDPKSVHGQFRHVRMTKAGTYLVAHLNMGKVVEYTSYPEAYQDLALGRTDYVVNTIINLKALVLEKPAVFEVGQDQLGRDDFEVGPRCRWAARPGRP